MNIPQIIEDWQRKGINNAELIFDLDFKRWVLIDTYNGFYLLEAVLKKYLGENKLTPKQLEVINLAEEFYSKNKCIKWELSNKINILDGTISVRETQNLYEKLLNNIVCDLDATGYFLHLKGIKPDEELIEKFLPKEDIGFSNPDIGLLCYLYGIDEKKILRLWVKENWKDEYDLVSVANFLSRINPNDFPEVYKANKELIRLIIVKKIAEGEIIPYLRGYYYPISQAIKLILLYNKKAIQPFLSEKEKQILLNIAKEIEEKMEEVFYFEKENPVYGFWGAGEEVVNIDNQTYSTLYYSFNIARSLNQVSLKDLIN